MNPTPQRLAAGGLAALGTASAIPIPIAQLDFAGLVNTFRIDHGDTPHAVLVIVAVAGVLTIGVIGLALAGVVLTLTGSTLAQPVLVTAAVAGLVTAMPGWIPVGILLGAAALVISRDLPTGAAPYPGEPQPRY
jgi:hypothetical protein